MYNEHNPYCLYKRFYAGKNYLLFKKSRFYSPLKDIIQNQPKISDRIKILRSLK